MRRNLLITVAATALVAGTVYAAAQDGQKQAPGASGGAMQHEQSQGAPGGARKGQEKAEPRGQPNGRAQSQQGAPRTTGQGQMGHEEGQKSEPKAGKGKSKTTGQGQQGHEAQQGHEGQQGGPKARQGQDQKEPKARQGQQERKGQTTGQGQQDKKGQTTGQQQQPPQGRQQQGQSKQGGGSSVTLTSEQRTKIRETVIRSNNAPRVTKLDFQINVGTVVPSHVRVVTVPEVIVEIHPEWRGYYYFVYEDEIIIVDSGHKIVAVINV